MRVLGIVDVLIQTLQATPLDELCARHTLVDGIELRPKQGL